MSRLPANTEGRARNAPADCTNAERSEYAGNAMAEYLASKGEPYDYPAEEYEIADLLTDLFHHADRLGFDIDRILRTASMHYEVEVGEEDAS